MRELNQTQVTLKTEPKMHLSFILIYYYYWRHRAEETLGNPSPRVTRSL